MHIPLLSRYSNKITTDLLQFMQENMAFQYGARLPERHHVAEFCGQAAELVGRQVQVHQVRELGDVGRNATQVVVVNVQCRQVGECPEGAAQVAHPP